MENRSYDTLVLSGGSTKGMIILGALQSAFDKGLTDKLKTYVGTSIGSIISYLLIIGYSPIEIMVYVCTHRLLERIPFFNLTALINGMGAISYTPLQEILEKMTLEKIGKFVTLKDLETMFGKTLVCVTYNRTRQMTEYISLENYPDLPCLTAVRMSSNVPLLFDKFRYMGFEYVDGGLTDNFGITKGEELGEKVLGIVLSPVLGDSEKEEKDENLLQYVFSLLYVPIHQSTISRIKASTLKSTIIDIPRGKNKMFDFNIKSSEKLDMFSSGYQSFCQKYDTLK